ncbi:MAG: alpha/beta hydrolase [Bacilli bacterium]|nr:alpha/beta hydrolase [Bacilli bacterium]MDD3305398.1 alpha/beta hydrolase [Bacilli bacterium]MDD4054105.1 alpha/beta hydrolase [Bacilli bacterium]MDD4411900.1 alpha/beta hydrolase [Bacilli bacterium]
MNLKDTYINYVQYGNEEGKDIVLLHGWGQNIEMMDPIGRRLQDDFRITIIDFPGFGKSPEPPYAFTVYNYYEVLDELLKKLKIKKPILIGHSFGGRIAMIYAATKPTSKLVLFGSPFRRSNKKANVKLKILKTMKKIPLIKNLEGYAKRHMGSRDYRNATPIMRQILVNVINTNLYEYLPKISASTILIWGSEDTEVPLDEAKVIESTIKDCGLIVYEGCTHYAYLERLDQTVNILNEFLKDVK